jgi:hypothetical protein
MWNMLTHRAQYVIYAPCIQRIINYKKNMMVSMEHISLTLYELL